MSSDIKYSTTPYCGTPGPPWEDFEERIINVAAKRVDDRGWSLADHLLAVDEGSPGVPMPISNAAELRKAQMGMARREQVACGDWPQLTTFVCSGNLSV